MASSVQRLGHRPRAKMDHARSRDSANRVRRNSRKSAAADPDAFEMRIRPVLAKACYTCHADAAMGGLQLDSREHLLKGWQIRPCDRPRRSRFQQVDPSHPL